MPNAKQAESALRRIGYSFPPVGTRNAANGELPLVEKWDRDEVNKLRFGE
ncbi:hypothetical protein [Rhizobium rhizophilum]|nr:hypothetical protein [Rhizobium rhizophilum]